VYTDIALEILKRAAALFFLIIVHVPQQST